MNGRCSSSPPSSFLRRRRLPFHPHLSFLSAVLRDASTVSLFMELLNCRKTSRSALSLVFLRNKDIISRFILLARIFGHAPSSSSSSLPSHSVRDPLQEEFVSEDVKNCPSMLRFSEKCHCRRSSRSSIFLRLHEIAVSDMKFPFAAAAADAIIPKRRRIDLFSFVEGHRISFLANNFESFCRTIQFASLLAAFLRRSSAKKCALQMEHNNVTSAVVVPNM